MTLTKAQYRILSAIGETPGTNAYALRNVLDRHQSGINRLCNELMETGYLSTKTSINEKGRPVNKLYLSITGFSLLISSFLHFEEYPFDASGPEDKHFIAGFNRKLIKIFDKNSMLHETIPILKDLFVHTVEEGNEPEGILYFLHELHSFLKPVIEQFEYFLSEHPAFVISKNGGAIIQENFRKAFYGDVVIGLSELYDFSHSEHIPQKIFLQSPFFRHPHGAVYTYVEEVTIPRLLKSEGRDLILSTITERIEKKGREIENLEKLRKEF